MYGTIGWKYFMEMRLHPFPHQSFTDHKNIALYSNNFSPSCLYVSGLTSTISLPLQQTLTQTTMQRLVQNQLVFFFSVGLVAQNFAHLRQYHFPKSFLLLPMHCTQWYIQHIRIMIQFNLFKFCIFLFLFVRFRRHVLEEPRLCSFIQRRHFNNNFYTYFFLLILPSFFSFYFF